MSTEVKNGTGAAASAADGAAPASQNGGDDLKNVKAEFNRKLGNLEQTNQQLIAQMQALTQKLAPAKPAGDPKKVSVFDDEDAFAGSIVEQAERRIEAKMAVANQAQQKQVQIINNLVADYPELAQQDHDLTKRAVELFEALPSEDKNHPLAYKTAVRDAAAELDIKPKSKRKSGGSDDFSLGSGSGERPARKADVDSRTLEFAKLMGMDTSDAKVVEKFKNKHGRKSYTDWA